MSCDVLIVDDVRSSLNTYGDLVRIDLEIEPFLADDPDEALNILKYYPIKVLVTDQNMPKMTGIELVNIAKRELNLKIPCIMLTAYTDDVSVIDAVNVGFFRFIDKKNIRLELIPAIRQAIQSYEMNALNNSHTDVNKLLLSKKRLKFRHEVNLRLLRVSSIIDTFIKEDDWHTEYTAQRNISQSAKLNISHKTSYSIESGIRMEILNNLGIKANKIVVELESILQSKISVYERINYEEELKIEAEYQLEVREITDTPTLEGLVLQSRQYQSAPVYIRVNCILQLDCTCCEVPRNFDVSIDLPTNRIALRQVEHFNRGQPKKIYTGFITGSFSDYT